MVYEYEEQELMLPLPDEFNYMPSGSTVDIDGGSHFVKERFTWKETGPKGLKRFADPAEIHSDLWHYGGKISIPE